MGEFKIKEITKDQMINAIRKAATKCDAEILKAFWCQDEMKVILLINEISDGEVSINLHNMLDDYVTGLTNDELETVTTAEEFIIKNDVDTHDCPVVRIFSNLDSDDKELFEEYAELANDDGCSSDFVWLLQG